MGLCLEHSLQNLKIVQVLGAVGGVRGRRRARRDGGGWAGDGVVAGGWWAAGRARGRGRAAAVRSRVAGGRAGGWVRGGGRAARRGPGCAKSGLPGEPCGHRPGSGVAPPSSSFSAGFSYGGAGWRAARGRVPCWGLPGGMARLPRPGPRGLGGLRGWPCPRGQGRGGRGGFRTLGVRCGGEGGGWVDGWVGGRGVVSGFRLRLFAASCLVPPAS